MSLDPRMELTVSDEDKPAERRDHRILRMRRTLSRDGVQIENLAKHLLLEALNSLKMEPTFSDRDMQEAFYIYAEAFRRAGDLMDEQAKR